MDKEMMPEEPAAPKVEAVPEDIQQEDPQQPRPPEPLQQYPSPRVEDSDASFFQGDRQLDQAPDHQHAEPPTPPQRASRPDVNAEDLQLGGPGEDQIQQLQLAAQMSQAISGVVGGSNPEEDEFDSQEPNLQSLQQLQDTPEAHMQGQEHVLPELPENIQPSIQQDLQQSLQHVMPHPDGQQEPQLYLAIVHHVLPFLPGSKDILNSHLANCSPNLRNAFIEALNSAIGSFAVRDVQGSLANANRLLADFEVEGGRKSQVSGLVHLQCLILMIINTDNVGPPSLTGEHEGPAKASLLGRAAGVAYAMSVPQEATALDGVSNVELDQCIRVRAWWTLVILDRWNALSTATPLIISGDTIVLPSNLKPIVGEANFRFTYVLWAVKESVGLLTTHSQMISPLNHHFTSLVALCLIELANLKASEGEAKELLNQLLEANIAPSSWDGPIRNKIRDTMRPVPNDSTEATASQSLQHLADLAAAEAPPAGVNNGAAAPLAVMDPDQGDIENVLKFRTSDTYEDLGFDPRQMLCGGYLNAIGQYPS
ncbi:Glucose-responsive transcription factor [Diaporthe eres]|uniref:Glucose-responsive transcription factor n=1 Tax=Diaporthe eres TaxID=83184 RepID=A0ABR1PI40_DIAER